MKKLLLAFLLIVTTVGNLFAQRDTEHWFAPMKQASSFSNYNQQALYLSTDSTTPFAVTIYNNNTVVTTVTISKGNPQRVSLDRTLLTSDNVNDLFKVSTKGLYLKGEKPFYATYRFSVLSHGEILTSKGKAGIGKKFYAVVSPQTTGSTSNNFTAGILATEDNTVVTISGYNPQITFSNNWTGTTNPTLTITLNKGQSYIVEGKTNFMPNRDGFIGAKIEATKPVSVTNGNHTGQFALTTPGSSGVDIIMDQSVPTERLGDQFVIVKGMGNISEEMEGAVVVATEDNTQVFVNNGTNPVATLNEGQYYRINSTAFVNQNNSGHYNLYIRTTKNVYVYQLLAGVATSDATLGFNYIPPLNCFLPRKIDEIGLIEQLPSGTTPTANLSGVTIKLNILTEAGAAVQVNGVTPTAAQGPFPVTGTNDWVSYSLTGVTGNITVTSDKAVTAGIIGGSGVVGYGGYFAGFSSIPAIAKRTGDCVPGIILEVDPDFDSYQWLLNGVPIPGANSSFYTPTVGGNYSVIVTMGSCAPVTTPEYPVYTCLVNSTQTINACGSVEFAPEFTSSTQTPVPASVQIITPPANGTATINATTGVITYTPNPGFQGNDQFVYKFCGDDVNFTDCEQVTVNINFVPLELIDQTLNACNVNGVGTFDLTTAVLTPTPNVVYHYYPSQADLDNGTNEILNLTSYTVAAPAVVYVKATTSNGCVDDGKIFLEYYPSPVVNNDALVTCFIPTNETMGEFDLTQANVTAEPNVTYVYYQTLSNAESNINPIANPTSYIAASGSAYVRVINDKGCVSIAKIELTVTPPKRSPLLVDQIICLENTTSIDAGPGYTSYLWSTGATTQSIDNVGVGTYWVDLEFDGCITRQTIEVIKSPNPVITNVDITDNTVTLTVTGGTPPYQYSLDNINYQDSNVFNNVPRGQNTFYVRDSYNCEPISIEITVPNLVNAITPNGDGVNDVVDYSALSYKDNIQFTVYDRYGNMIFNGDKKTGLIWDGRFSGRKVLTDTYWYVVTWNEPGSTSPIKYSGWILVKNRE